MEVITLPDARPNIARCVHRPLLALAAVTWACYLASLLPLGAGSEVVQGLLSGFFAGAIVFGSIAAGASLWASLWVRRSGCYLAALLTVPLAGLCWWQLIFLVARGGA